MSTDPRMPQSKASYLKEFTAAMKKRKDKRSLFLPFSSSPQRRREKRYARDPQDAQDRLDCYLEQMCDTLLPSIHTKPAEPYPRLKLEGLMSTRALFHITLTSYTEGRISVSIGYLQFLWACNAWLLDAIEESAGGSPTERQHAGSPTHTCLLDLADWFLEGEANANIAWPEWCRSDRMLDMIDAYTESQTELLLYHEIAHLILGHIRPMQQQSSRELNLRHNHPILTLVRPKLEMELAADERCFELLFWDPNQRQCDQAEKHADLVATYAFFYLLSTLELMCAGYRSSADFSITYQLKGAHPSFADRFDRFMNLYEDRFPATAESEMHRIKSVLYSWLFFFRNTSGNLIRARMQQAIGSFDPLSIPPSVGRIGDFLNPYSFRHEYYWLREDREAEAYRP